MSNTTLFSSSIAEAQAGFASDYALRRVGHQPTANQTPGENGPSGDFGLTPKDQDFPHFSPVSLAQSAPNR
jgi:hypothetical protein